jgi:chemotaxis protein methyltransferase CheR
MNLEPSISAPPATSVAAVVLSAADFRVIAGILHEEARIHLSEAKINLVQSRLARRLRERRLDSFAAYLRLVREDGDERSRMIDALTTNHTHFFREKHHFDDLRSHVLPRLQARAEAGQPVRLWSAGSSSGEEIYSMAMTLAGTGAGDARWLGRDVRLLATDLSPSMVEAVAAARYPAIGADHIPLPYRAAWLQADGAEIVVDPALRALITARTLNLFAPWPFRGQFDVIFCRNVMIYFEADARAELEARLIAQLRPGGTLYIGHSERLSPATAASVLSSGQTIYRKPEHG